MAATGKIAHGRNWVDSCQTGLRRPSLGYLQLHSREMMSNPSVDPLILNGWLSARSIARGLPAPVAEYGGFRIDTKSDAEVARWVFPKMGAGLEEIARSICEPRYFLKLCGNADELRAALPRAWELHALSYFMHATSAPPRDVCPTGMRLRFSTGVR